MEKDIKEILHDMRGLLCSISGFVEIFQDRNEKEADQLKLVLDSINKLGQNLEELEKHPKLKK